MDNKKTKSEKFFGMFTSADVKKAGQTKTIMAIILIAVLVLVIFFQSIIIAASTIQPLPVIEVCRQTGEVTIYRKVVASDETDDILVKFFVEKFAKLYSEQSPDAMKNFADAYNMMTPALQKILDAEGKDANRAVAYSQKNVKADFFLDKIQISGDYKKNGKGLQFLATGYIYFRPAVGFDGDYTKYEKMKVYTFLQGSLFFYGHSERVPYGLLMDYFKIDYFEGKDLLDIFLMKSKINLTEKRIPETVENTENKKEEKPDSE